MGVGVGFGVGFDFGQRIQTYWPWMNAQPDDFPPEQKFFASTGAHAKHAAAIAAPNHAEVTRKEE